MAKVTAETEEQVRQQQADFDAIPDDRVFYAVKLWVDPEGNGIEGAGFYNGPKLKAMGLSLPVAAMCNNAAQLAHKGCKHAVSKAIELADLGQLLGALFGLGETDDSKDSNDTEGSDDSERAATASE